MNEASHCKVFWQIGTSATFGTTTRFVGTVLASASVTATTGTDVVGRLVAPRRGARVLTIDGARGWSYPRSRTTSV